MTRDDLLHIYLRDHLAGATGGLSLARRLAENQGGRGDDGDLEAVADEIAEDRRSLIAIMEAVGARHSTAKLAFAAVAERLRRFKLNGELWRRSPLSDVLELEMMRMGVEGKASGWRSLRQLARTDPRLDEAELGRLVARAESQSGVLEQVRIRAAAEVFTPPS